jgi:hypothetical protein
MNLGWRILIPLDHNIIITGIVILRADIAAYFDKFSCTKKRVAVALIVVETFIMIFKTIKDWNE